MKHFYFDLDNPADIRGKDAQMCAHSNGIISAARIGCPASEGLIEDNGLGASEITHKGFSLAEAIQLLVAIFDGVREAPPMEIADAAITAAATVLTLFGIIYRSAGDAVIAVIGDNGRVVILNKFHSEGHGIYHYLRPSQPSSAEGNIKEDGFISWSELATKLSTEKMRVAVMSDGITSSDQPEQVARDIEILIKSYNIPFDDRAWAQKLVAAASDAPHYFYKKDDKVVVSAMRPGKPQQEVLIAAFDGASPGKEHSAKVAYLAVRKAHEEVKKLSESPQHQPQENAPSRLPLFSQSVLPAQGKNSQSPSQVALSYQDAQNAAILYALKMMALNLVISGITLPAIKGHPVVAPFATIAYTGYTIFNMAKIILNARNFSKRYTPTRKAPKHPKWRSASTIPPQLQQ